MTEKRDVTARGFSIGDQVKIVAREHPWHGAIGRIIEPFTRAGLDWAVELETVNPGQRAGAAEWELRRV